MRADMFRAEDLPLRVALVLPVEGFGRYPSSTMRLFERRSGSTSPRFSRHRRSAVAGPRASRRRNVSTQGLPLSKGSGRSWSKRLSPDNLDENGGGNQALKRRPGGELGLVQLDQVLGLSARTIEVGLLALAP